MSERITRGDRMTFARAASRNCLSSVPLEATPASNRLLLRVNQHHVIKRCLNVACECAILRPIRPRPVGDLDWVMKVNIFGDAVPTEGPSGVGRPDSIDRRRGVSVCAYAVRMT